MARATPKTVTVARNPFQGVTQIIRFNWPYYVIGAIASVAGFSVLVWADLSRLGGAIVLFGMTVTVFWLLASILVSFYVYDLSPLYRWDWLHGVVDKSPRVWVNFHAGLDETTAAIRRLFPGSEGNAIDIYDPGKMDERSIQRARRAAPKSRDARSGDFSALPLEDSECDTAFLILAAHEVRDPADRLRLFMELRRILKPGGTLILVEHLRDAWNFAAYGPGVRHFFTRAEWLRVTKDAHFSICNECKVTPFIRCLVFSREQDL